MTHKCLKDINRKHYISFRERLKSVCCNLQDKLAQYYQRHYFLSLSEVCINLYYSTIYFANVFTSAILSFLFVNVNVSQQKFAMTLKYNWLSHLLTLSLSLPFERYSRNEPYALNWISTFNSQWASGPPPHAVKQPVFLH